MIKDKNQCQRRQERREKEREEQAENIIQFGR